MKASNRLLQNCFTICSYVIQKFKAGLLLLVYYICNAASQFACMLSNPNCITLKFGLKITVLNVSKADEIFFQWNDKNGEQNVQSDKVIETKNEQLNLNEFLNMKCFRGITNHLWRNLPGLHVLV